MRVTDCKNRTGANALKNGSRQHRLILGKLPKPLAQTGRVAAGYRRGIEAAVREAKGEISIVDAHHIDSATQHQLHMGICRWLMRTRIDSMSVHDIRECSKTIAKAADSRNRAIAQLKLDHVDAIASLYAEDDSSVLDACSPPEVTKESPSD